MDVRVALDRYAEFLDILCAYVADCGYDPRLALEPKPDEPRGDMLLATVCQRWPSLRGSSARRWWGSTPSSPTR